SSLTMPQSDFISTLNTAVGPCATSTFIAAPNPLPANSKIYVLSSSVPTNTYAANSLASLCGQTIYVVFSSGITSGTGNFQNTGAGGFFCIRDVSCSNCTQTVSYVDGASTDGDYVSWTNAGTATLANTNCVGLAALVHSISAPSAPNCMIGSVCTIPCFDYIIPYSSCNNTTDDFFVAVISPRPLGTDGTPIGSDCTGTTPIATTARNYTTVCPTVTLSGGGDACAPATVPLTFTFVNPSSGFTATINYTIDGVAQTPITGVTASPYIFNATTSGTYEITSVTFTSPASICDATLLGSADVIVSPVVAANITGGTSPATCTGSGTVTVALTGVGPWSFTLRNTTTGANYDISTDVSPYTATGLAPGTYSIVSASIRDDNNCLGTTTGTYTVTAPADQPSLAAISQQYVCSTSPVIDLTALNPSVVGGLAPGTYTWYYDDPSLPGTHIAVANPSAETVVATRTYYVQYTDANMCEAYSSVLVNLSVPPALSLMAVNQVCAPATPASITVTIPAATGYSYTITTGMVGSGTLATATAATSTTLTFTGTAALSGTGGGFPTSPTTTGTAYTIRVFDATSGCYTDSTRTVFSAVCFVCPTIGAISSVANYCQGGNFSVTATGLADLCMVNNTEADFGIDFVNFAGSTPPADAYTGGTLFGTISYAVINACSGTATGSMFGAGLAAGDYTICAILSPVSSNSACRPQQCTTYTIHPLPAVTATSNSPVCVGQTINLMTTAPTGLAATAYDWTGANGYTQNDTQNPSITSATTAMAGNYTVTVTDANACTGVSTVAVVVNALPTITLGTNPIVCAGSTVASLAYTATTNSPNQYIIDFDAAANTAGITDVALTTLPVSPISITLPSVLAAGTYNGMITVTNSTTTCSSTPTPITITVNDSIAITAVASCTGITQPMAGMSLDISTYTPQYKVLVSSVTGGNNATYNVTVNGVTQVYSGAPLTFGPFNHSLPLTGNVPVTVLATDAAPSAGQPTCLGAITVDETICAPSGAYCDCAGVAPTPASAGVVIAQSTPGTYNSNGYT
ncbi:MAG: hypothetical protein WAS72_11715, partial [Saprospiraceae bacterium]